MAFIERFTTKGLGARFALGAAAAGLLAGAAALGPMLSPRPAAAAAAPAPAAAGPTVRIDNFTFSPATLVVKPGTTVTWVNNDDIPHTVRAVDGSFRSKTLDSNERFSTTLSKPGEHAYFCSLHPHMTGKVIVKG
jgi:plastocyanin